VERHDGKTNLYSYWKLTSYWVAPSKHRLAKYDGEWECFNHPRFGTREDDAHVAGNSRAEAWAFAVEALEYLRVEVARLGKVHIRNGDKFKPIEASPSEVKVVLTHHTVKTVQEFK
jgi:hypothetical protein